MSVSASAATAASRLPSRSPCAGGRAGLFGIDHRRCIAPQQQAHHQQRTKLEPSATAACRRVMASSGFCSEWRVQEACGWALQPANFAARLAPHQQTAPKVSLQCQLQRSPPTSLSLIAGVGSSNEWGHVAAPACSLPLLGATAVPLPTRRIGLGCPGARQRRGGTPACGNGGGGVKSNGNTAPPSSTPLVLPEEDGHLLKLLQPASRSAMDGWLDAHERLADLVQQAAGGGVRASGTTAAGAKPPLPARPLPVQGCCTNSRLPHRTMCSRAWMC